MKNNKLSREEKIAKIYAEIDRLNDECAAKMAEVIGSTETRILSYTKQQEVDRLISEYTKKIAKFVVDKEELEENWLSKKKEVQKYFL